MELPGTEEKILPSGFDGAEKTKRRRRRRRRRNRRRNKGRGIAAEEMLPSDCWEKIFDKLDEYKEWGPISLVCKSFLSITNTMRRKLDFHVTDYYVDNSSPYYVTAPEISRRLLVRFPRLEEIRLFRDDISRTNNRGAIDSVMLEIFKNYHPTTSLLRSLHITCRCDCNYHPKLLNPFASCAPAVTAMSAGLNNNIKVLTCSVCGMDDRFLQDIGNSFPFLEELYLSDPCRRLLYFDEKNQFLISKFKYLKKISLSGKLFDTSLVALSSCTSLTHLSIVGLTRNITARAIGDFLAHCPNLVSLSLSRAISSAVPVDPLAAAAAADFPSFTTIKNSITYYPRNLQCLELPCSFQVNDYVLSCIARANLSLKKISFVASRCTLSGLMLLLGTYHPTLSSLCIRDAEFLEDDSLANLLLNSSCAKNLTEIGLDACSNLTNSTFLLLVRNCPSLTSIKMTDTSLGKGNNNLHKEASQNENIQQLNILSNDHMDNRTLESIGKLCPNLKHLCLVPSPQVTSKGIAKILKRCNKIRVLHLLDEYNTRGFKPNMGISELSNLEELYVRHSPVRDEDLVLIANSCCSLRTLDLESNFYITDTSVMVAIQKCKWLKQINLRDCHRLSKQIRSKILAINPLLRISTSR